MKIQFEHDGKDWFVDIPDGLLPAEGSKEAAQLLAAYAAKDRSFGQLYADTIARIVGCAKAAIDKKRNFHWCGQCFESELDKHPKPKVQPKPEEPKVEAVK